MESDFRLAILSHPSKRPGWESDGFYFSPLMSSGWAAGHARQAVLHINSIHYFTTQQFQSIYFPAIQESTYAIGDWHVANPACIGDL